MSDFLTALLNTAPGQAAVDTVTRELAAWQQLPRRHQAIRNQLLEISARARDRGEPGRVAIVAAAMRGLEQAQADYSTVSPLVGDVIAMASAGKVNVVSAARAAAGMVGVFSATRNVEAATDQAARGILSAEERQQLGIKSSGLPSWVVILGIGVAGYAFVRHAGRRRSSL